MSSSEVTKAQGKRAKRRPEMRHLSRTISEDSGHLVTCECGRCVVVEYYTSQRRRRVVVSAPEAVTVHSWNGSRDWRQLVEDADAARRRKSLNEENQRLRRQLERIEEAGPGVKRRRGR